MERAGGQAGLDLASVGLPPDHEVFATATTDEFYCLRGHKEGLLRVRLGKERARKHVTLLEGHEEKVSRSRRERNSPRSCESLRQPSEHHKVIVKG